MDAQPQSSMDTVAGSSQASSSPAPVLSATLSGKTTEARSNTENTTQPQPRAKPPPPMRPPLQDGQIDLYSILDHEDPILTLGETDPILEGALEEIATDYPPRESYEPKELAGFWHGPTGLAYLFLHVSKLHPHLEIAGRSALTWAKCYILGGRDDVRLAPKRCGIGSEALARLAVEAAIMKDLDKVGEFLLYTETILEDEYPNELLHGRAGTLYLLRLMRHWVPESGPLVEKAIKDISKRIMADWPDWEWMGKPYIGAVHGDISIVTQLVLTTPSMAPDLEGKMIELLRAQLGDGNWPSFVGSKSPYTLTQFCHGAPGFVSSFISLRPHFPHETDYIDRSIGRAREHIWKKGLLSKEPNLCHGILGNALALEHGSRQDHFLAFAAPQHLKQMMDENPRLFQPADYDCPFSLTTSYAPSAAWAYMMRGKGLLNIIGYNDV